MILLLGFPKSGTSSFQKLFSDLGYKSYHWVKDDQYIGNIIKNNKQNNKPLLSGFEKTDCITQMDVCLDENNAYFPQLIDYKQIYYENIDSIFILNKRDPTNLLSSFKRWKKYDERLCKYNPEIISDNSDEAFIELFKNHYENIESFFSLYPNAKFITFDIENDDIEKLGKYIDLKNITVFPKINVNIFKN